MMTVEEEVARAVQIAGAPQKVTSTGVSSVQGAPFAGMVENNQEVAEDSLALLPGFSQVPVLQLSDLREFKENVAKSGTACVTPVAAIGRSPSPVISSPGSVSVQRSPAFSISGNSGEGKVKCDECGKNFSNKAKLHFHTKIIHRGERLPCKVSDCEKTFRGYDVREKHMRMMHGSTKMSPNQERSSDKVLKGVPSKERSEHSEAKWEVSPKTKIDDMSPHKEVGKVKCDECGKNFINIGNLNRHSKIIHRGEKLQCKVADCEETFRRNEARENHMRMEHGSPMLSCKFKGCTSEFYSKCGLSHHHLTHTK